MKVPMMQGRKHFLFSLALILPLNVYLADTDKYVKYSSFLLTFQEMKVILEEMSFKEN